MLSWPPEEGSDKSVHNKLLKSSYTPEPARGYRGGPPEGDNHTMACGAAAPQKKRKITVKTVLFLSPE